MAEMSRPSTNMLFDLAFGIVVMGTVGALIGTFLGAASIPVTSGVGVLLGAVVGFLGGRRFLASILVGTVLGGLLAWMIAGLEKVSFGAGAGAAMGGFLGVQISMLLDVRAARKAAQVEESEDAGAAHSAVTKS
ncbi:conserved membrane hypothetical protein [Nitrospira defluvii]|uniref:Uncharacterized protein n=2 Tax=Nitrospira defluvii TaxID=330214 RepID=A0ABM8RBS2_9BACT|nr:conserved membrane hypothetical protein [Nitrospira defluvii]